MFAAENINRFFPPPPFAYAKLFVREQGITGQYHMHVIELIRP